MRLVGVDRGRDPVALPLGQPLDPAPLGQADPEQRVTRAACLQRVAEGLLLDPACWWMDLVKGLPTQLHYVKRVDDSDGVLQLVKERPCHHRGRDEPWLTTVAIEPRITSSTTEGVIQGAGCSPVLPGYPSAVQSSHFSGPRRMLLGSHH